MADIKLETNKLFCTFKTQEEAIEYMEMHIPFEKASKDFYIWVFS
jgi:hypothetical protein